jgi:hypothetical protein
MSNRKFRVDFNARARDGGYRILSGDGFLSGRRDPYRDGRDPYWFAIISAVLAGLAGLAWGGELQSPDGAGTSFSAGPPSQSPRR